MKNSPSPCRLRRRDFLSSTAAFLVLDLSTGQARTINQSVAWEPRQANPPAPAPLGPWTFFTADEAALVEAIVDRLIPADSHGPGGKETGCAVFIDQQLAGPYGRAEGLFMQPPFAQGLVSQGLQTPDAPAARYRSGLKAIADYVRAAFSGKTFRQLTPQDQDKVLSGLESGLVLLEDVDGAEFFALLLGNTMEGYFADPVYGGNRNMVGWKLLGFPGARYDYRDWIDRHNEPYPLPPVGIMGRPEWKAR
jgi:gluconate 2-dehydrogenase gamma chain